jgi:hypothetical protein
VRSAEPSDLSSFQSRAIVPSRCATAASREGWTLVIAAADRDGALLSAPEQAMTVGLGRFVLRRIHRGLATLVARRIAYVPASSDLVIPIDSTIMLRIEAQPPALATMTVVAVGEYSLGTGKVATLTPLQVARTPGWSHAAMPGGDAVYLPATAENLGYYVRVIPNWVGTMKRAVDEANK